MSSAPRPAELLCSLWSAAPGRSQSVMTLNDKQTFFLVTLICFFLAVITLWRSVLLKPFRLWYPCWSSNPGLL